MMLVLVVMPRVLVMLVLQILTSVFDLLRMTTGMGFLVMMVMVFVYHSFVHFPRAKVRRTPCNRVAIFAGNG